MVGYAASLRFHQRPAYAPSVMTSIYLHPDHTGQGIGERVYSELLDNLRETEDAHRAYGLVVLPNPGSERLHENSVFRWRACSVREGSSSVNTMACGCTNTAWGSNSLCDQRYC